MSIDIELVESKKQFKAFINFQHSLYKNDPYYVPELQLTQKDLFSSKKNPFFDSAEIAPFVAKKNGKIVGRVVAINNKRYNEFHNSNVGFFGFFDFIDDTNVSRSLLDQVVQWSKDKGHSKLLGPCNFSTNDTAGLLIEGYEDPPKIMMTYNKAYYLKHIESYGFTKEMDLFAYILYTKKASEKSIRLAQTLEKRLANQGITIRNINMKDFHNEVKKIMSVYNSAWQNNWGFVPMTENEIQHLASNLRMIVNKDWVYIAEDKGVPIGIGITLNNVNEITKSFNFGKLFPFNIFKLLKNRHKTDYVRIITLGVIDGYRKRGIEAIFFAKNILQARKDGVIAGEVSWVLENNEEMIMAAEKLNADLYKKYRIFKYDFLYI